ncbi:hypothetical protein HF086_012209 [Spodoptera exigua]|uniref:Uncharacterized protein n=1 Tax=Spodoptera exigua TaxID=7107 RepID=A0A922MD34_SPOEX|nr:hypothetical protein HF086_012209 [Spodoptera exigua]
MATTALYILLAATAVAAVQVAFVPPAATSYIYRSDNNGPASYIQLGAPAPIHHAPHNAFAPPLPIIQPKFGAIEALDLAPVPLPYVAAKPIVVEDAEDDDDDDDDDDSESSEEYSGHDHGHAFAKGGGSNYGEKHHSAHGEKGSKGYHTEDHHAKGEAGHYGKKHDEGYYKEAEGGEKGHHDEAAVHGKHYKGGKSYKGGDHGHKKHFSKGEDITGYHKVFHKDEFKKDHDFYDVADKSGHFNKHGHENEHHGSEEGGHKEGGHHDSASNKGEFGKSGFHAKGHINDAEAGHSAEDGHESHYHNEADFGKKGGSSHGKEYAFANDDDDDDDDDDSHYDDKE